MKSITIALVLALSTFAEASTAQVIPDGTVGSIVSPTNVITGGTRSGNNLFHSFSQFSIPTNGSAFFNNATDVQNIFSRVTGTSQSSIDGLIKAQGNANLFLMNPNGIVFGPNARLQIGGSFVGTTANSIKFADGVQFSSSDPTSNPLLTVNMPIGLQMGSSSGGIQVAGPGHQLRVVASGLAPLNSSRTPPGLQVASNKTLALIGADVALVGGILKAPGGHIELGSLRIGTVNLTSDDHGWSFDYASNSQLQDIRLSQRSIVDTSGDGGSIQLRAQNILFSDLSTALIQHSGSQRGGDLILNAADTIAFSQNEPNELSTRIETQTLGLGSTGEVKVTAKHLSLKNEAMINATSYGSGGSGALRIMSTESIELFGLLPTNNPNVSRIGAIAVRGRAGDIFVSTKQLSLRDGGSIFSVTFGKETSGNVNVNVTNFIEILGVKPNAVSSSLSSSTFGSGNAGSLIVNTPRLAIQNGGRIASATHASGNAGSLIVNASERIDISGVAEDIIQRPSSIVASAESATPIIRFLFGLPPVPTGSAGSVMVNTPQLSIKNAALIGVSNIGSGNAGNMKISANQIRLDNKSKLTASTASGEGGNITLNVRDTLIMRNNSLINTNARGSGNGGNMTINSPIILGLENSDIIANAIKGSGGNINIATQGLIGLKYRDRLTPENDITASSEFGVNGAVQINSLGLDPSSGLVKLNSDIVDSSRSISKGCSANQGNSFVSTGRGGIPQDPANRRMVDRSWHDLRTPIASQSTLVNLSKIQNPESKIVEASQIQINADGSIALVDGNPIDLANGATCSGAKVIQ